MPGASVLHCLDDLSCGPLRPIADIGRWQEERTAWWKSVLGPPGELPEPWPGQRIAESPEIVVLAGTILAEQLFLVWVRQALRLFGVEDDRLRLVQFRRDARGRSIGSTMSLRPAEIAAGLPTVRSLSRREFDDLDAVWRSVVCPDPTDLDRLIADEKVSLSTLRASLPRVLDRFPEERSGLNLFDRTLLSATRSEGPRAPRIVGEALQLRRKATDQVGDGWLFWRLRRMGDSQLRQRPVDIHSTSGEMRDTEATLTADGARFLRGRFNYLDCNGIDDWVTGVHLDSVSGDVWMRDRRGRIRRKRT
jgi:hypothetical protein